MVRARAADKMVKRMTVERFRRGLKFSIIFSVANQRTTPENAVGSFTAEICCGVSGIKYYIFHVKLKSVTSRWQVAIKCRGFFVVHGRKDNGPC
mmetsp:Transcript_17091/g.35753  ORF Transcript_17091/g.35753 Transcript_17091/m.35753 type:complete len:94 (+) Transcript_17091:756-1037(+)